MNDHTDFVIEDGVLAEYKGSSENFIIPEEVTIIGHRVFLEHAEIKSDDIHRPHTIAGGEGKARKSTKRTTAETVLAPCRRKGDFGGWNIIRVGRKNGLFSAIYVRSSDAPT